MPDNHLMPRPQPEPRSTGLSPSSVGEPLTRREARILDFIITYLIEHLYQPSLREICAACGTTSTRTASELIQALADKGYVALPPEGWRPARAIRLVGVEITVRRALLPPGRQPAHGAAVDA